jgi:hypothetical protein
MARHVERPWTPPLLIRQAGRHRTLAVILCRRQVKYCKTNHSRSSAYYSTAHYSIQYANPPPPAYFCPHHLYAVTVRFVVARDPAFLAPAETLSHPVAFGDTWYPGLPPVAYGDELPRLYSAFPSAMAAGILDDVQRVAGEAWACDQSLKYQLLVIRDRGNDFAATT